ncbi:hypothetical protein MUK42_19606 [Musa troglodytarum]|uniref:Uncharacterized protein n=2 Tax=Musa troglodytarum TaxID=320322 RepID=A0A9E7FY37_9LILI|nr:hypothetical protein MUK42_19606 [Musa troglodytarum]
MTTNTSNDLNKGENLASFRLYKHVTTNHWPCRNLQRSSFRLSIWRKTKFIALMDQKKPLNHLLALLLLSCLLSADAAPLSGTFALKNQDEAAMKVADQVINKEMPEEGGVSLNKRMDFELDDYPGSGANSRHDPKNPGKP